MYRFITCFLIVFGLFLIPGKTHAQYKKKMEKLAAELMQQRDYYNAARYYGMILNIDSSRAENNFHYAEALRLSNDNDKALHYYEVTYKLDRGKEFPDALYWIAELHKFQYDYTKARRYFKRAERYYRGRKSTYYYAKVNQEQESCNIAARLYKSPLDIEVTNLGKGVNSVGSEFAGYFLNDSLLYYSSLRPEADKEGGDTLYKIRIYEALKQADKWKNTDRELDEINAKRYDVANGVFNLWHNRFYFTICTDTNNQCEIYYATYQDGKFGEPVALPRKINLPGSTNTQPSFSEMKGEEVMFFASNREGGYGQLDIWYCISYSNGVLGEPVNAGEMVNTLGNDITPFYHTPSKTLYFSSDWHHSLGGFDIFKSKYRESAFEAPENYGYPVNSSVNDFYFRAEGNTAILTSNRIGSFTEKSSTCCNDLYLMPFEFDMEEEEDPKQEAYDDLVRFLPLRLFFHNDEPDPRSRNTMTSRNYVTTFQDYINLLERYKREYSKGLKGDEKLDAQEEIADFFDLEVQEGADNLQRFTSLLLDELEKGREITLTVKGFASPLSKSDYNSNLTLRRISSIENFFREYNEGVLIPFMDKGQLVIQQQPFGEDHAATDVSDNINDQRNSIYSKRAAFERRVEIISLTLD